MSPIIERITLCKYDFISQTNENPTTLLLSCNLIIQLVNDVGSLYMIKEMPSYVCVDQLIFLKSFNMTFQNLKVVRIIEDDIVSVI